MQDDIFVIDGVTHAFDMTEANYAEPRYAEPICTLQAGLLAGQPPGYDLEVEASKIDWPVDDTANMLFRESGTDVAIFHPVPIFFFKDGLCGFDKALEAVTRWPDRFIGSYITVDPLRPDPIGEMERQYEQISAVSRVMGLKLYPISYSEGTVTPWEMDDPKIGFPLYEKAMELGIRNVATHKSLPLGPAPTGEAFHPRDVEGAANAYPDLTFEIVHGGMSFNEETAWLLGRIPNVWINLETFNIVLMLNPRAFAEMFAGLLAVGGEGVLDKMFWGSGSMNCHARPGLEAFMDFEFPDDLRAKNGIFGALPQLTHEHKRKILGGNLARAHHLDVDALAAAIKDDEFVSGGSELAAPYSTTTVAGRTISQFDGAASAA